MDVVTLVVFGIGLNSVVVICWCVYPLIVSDGVVTRAGYMKNRGTRYHLVNLITLIQKHNDHNIDLRICFIDYSRHLTV